METSPGVGWSDEVVDQVEEWGFEVREVEALIQAGEIA